MQQYEWLLKSKVEWKSMTQDFVQYDFISIKIKIRKN